MSFCRSPLNSVNMPVSIFFSTLMTLSCTQGGPPPVPPSALPAVELKVAFPQFDELVSAGEVHSSKAKATVARLYEVWASTTSQQSNFHQAGFDQLYFGLHDLRFGFFPYRSPPIAKPELRFANFGPAGFVVGETHETSSKSPSQNLKWLVLSLNRENILPHLEGQHLVRAAFSPESPLNQPPLLGDHGPLLNLFGKDFAALGLQPSRQIAHLYQLGGVNCLARLGGKIAHARNDFQCMLPEKGKAVDDKAEKSKAQGTQPASLKEETSETVCQPLGVRSAQGLEVITRSPESVCVFFHAPRDSRSPQGAAQSLVSCIDIRGTLLHSGSSDKVQSVIPSRIPDEVLLYEGSYQPAKVTRLNTRTFLRTEVLSSSSAGKPGSNGVPLAFGSTQKSSAPALPGKSFGVYRCEQKASEPEFFYLDADVFAGRRALDEGTETVWRLRESTEGSLEVRPLVWPQVVSEFPALNLFPGLECLSAPAIDVKCGLRVMQQAGQIAIETLDGTVENTMSADLRPTLYLLAFLSVRKVHEALPDWQLHNETLRLGNFLLTNFNRTAAVFQLKAPASAFPAELVAKPNSPVLFEGPKLKKYLSLPDELWSRL